MKNPLTFGRKFYACLLALAVVVTIFMVAIKNAPSAITALSVVAFGAFVITICFAYIGGNVWSAWVKSKYFQPGLK